MNMRVSLGKGRGLKKNGAVLFLLPGLCGFMVFYLIPFLGGMYYSFVDSPVGGRFVGLKNFMDLMSNEAFIKASTNTALFMLISVPANIIISLLLSLMLARVVKRKNTLLTLFVSPLVIPVASVAFFWQILFNIKGPLNQLLSLMCISPVDWLNTSLARPVIVMICLWKNLGYNMVLFTSGLSSIPSQYYEAADIDGAGSLRKFFGITAIYLAPTLFFVFVISIINSFKVFREVYLISGQYPNDSIYMLQHFMNNMFASMDYQKLTSASLAMSAVIFILVMILFILERRISSNIEQ